MEAEKDIEEILILEPNNQDGIKLQIEMRKKRKEQREKEKLMSRVIIENLNFDGQQQPLKDIKNEIPQTLPQKISIKKRMLNIKILVVDILKNEIEKSVNKIKCRIEDTKDSIESTAQMTLNSVKLMFLLPLNLMSERCCRRRLPSQFFKTNLPKKQKKN